MEPPYPSLTSTWHNDTYPSISPSRPELSVAGKTVVIAGAVSPFYIKAEIMPTDTTKRAVESAVKLLPPLPVLVHNTSSF